MKTTIDLEKSLIKENRKLLMPKELLLVNEYDKFAPLLENDALPRVGLNRTIKKGKEIKTAKDQNYMQTKMFAQDRVFHISQIEGICKKYRLRFLPTEMYKGVIDNDLPNRISTFEVAYNVRCTPYNTRIVAPKESFKLKERPKDPLMFYKINDEYFYLIHKWGNDLSISRAILPLFSNTLFCWLSVPILLFFVLFPFSLQFALELSSSFLVVTGFFYAFFYFILDTPLCFLSQDNWDSEYD
jgi:hypothetical protein